MNCFALIFLYYKNVKINFLEDIYNYNKAHISVIENKEEIINLSESDDDNNEEIIGDKEND